MITLVCLGISLIALIIALGELERIDEERAIQERLGDTPWTRKQAV